MLLDVWIQELQTSWNHIPERFASITFAFDPPCHNISTLILGILILGITSFTIATMWLVSDSLFLLLQQDVCVVQ